MGRAEVAKIFLGAFSVQIAPKARKFFWSVPVNFELAALILKIIPVNSENQKKRYG